ncbi:MAG: hypothetical protein GEU83_20515 [Pseudonocardiaceae bacterium]|nr:hypothetical protein [Pseudonocardiaceae bacterium]
MLGGLTPTFLNLASPGLSDVPGRLMIFLAAAVVVFLVGNALSPETRGAMERESFESSPADIG